MSEDLKALEAELQQERDALQADEAERERANKAAALRAEIEDVKRKQRESKALAAAEAKYGPCGKRWGKVETLDGLVLVQGCDGVRLKKWQDDHVASDAPITADAYRELGRPCVFYPEMGDLDAMVADRPLVMTHIALEVLRLGGLKAAARGKA